MPDAEVSLGPPWPEPLVALADRCVFPAPGTHVDLAVSGGADSSALLVLAVVAGCVPRVLHVDHQLRDSSAAEADVVAALAARLGVAFRALRVHVPDGPNLEARAREARYGVLPDGVLTGHTLDDRAESVLGHLLRGTGLDGLATLSQHGVKRPLVHLRRADTAWVCATCGIDVVDDPSNRNPRFLRNRVRHELLPLMCDIAQRDVAPLIARMGDNAASDVRTLDALAAGIDATDARALAQLPSGLARRALRTWLAGAHDGYAPSQRELDRVMAVVQGTARATELAGGWRVDRSHQRLRLTPPQQRPADGSPATRSVAVTSDEPAERGNMPAADLHEDLP